MEKMGPSSPKMGKTMLDLIRDKESQVGEERKKFGCQLTSKYPVCTTNDWTIIGLASMSSKLKLQEAISSTDKPISGNMDDFTFPILHAGGGPCKQLVPSAFSHQLGLVAGGSPPPWFLATTGGKEGEDEEKMDMLWEDFNEELASVPPLCPLSPVINKQERLETKEEAWLEDELIVVDMEKSMKHLQHPQDGRVVRRRRWSVRLMLRLLKKLFLVKKSRNPRTAPI
nr:unnamed protein product [Digitaria exilis]